MPFKQTYYTSCENGLRGGKGFQINAASEGIEVSALQEIERLGLYVPPVSAPSRPSQEEIDRFPVSLLFQRLNDGGAILAQARYIGCDYSGRYGNYFTHSVISTNPEKDLHEQGVLPIELWGAPSWTTTESTGTTLPLLDRLEAGGIVQPDSLIAFLRENKRMEVLPAFLTAVEGALTTGRRLVMVDTARSVAMWISAASYVLPRHLAMRLTFNTYVKNPYLNDFLIVGTTTDSDFNFAPHELNHQFFVFDFEDRRFTPINEITAFASMASATFEHTEVLGQFSQFVEKVAPDLSVGELAPAFACHSLSHGIESPEAVASQTLEWCATRLGQLDLNSLTATLNSVVNGCPDRSSVLTAYTNLYNSALLTTTPLEIRVLVEVPYLEYLIRQASLDVPIPTINQVASSLRVNLAAGTNSDALMLSWANRLRQCDDVERLPALFAIADKVGFLKITDDVLHIVGEEVIGPRLAQPLVTDLVLRYIASPGMQSIMTGVAAFLETQVGTPNAFRPYTSALTHDEIYKLLGRYAFQQQSLAFYFRLIGARASDLAAVPQPRLDAFEECLEAIKALAKSLPDDLVENAFNAVWQDREPSLLEATQLLDMLERLQLTTSIPKRLVNLITACPLLELQPPHQQLLERLGGRGPFYEKLDECQIVVDIYRIPAELELSSAMLAEEISASIDHVARHRSSLNYGLIKEVGTVIAKYLTQVKDTEAHVSILLRGHRLLDGPAFLESYLRTIQELVKEPASTRVKIAARFIRIANLVSKQNGPMISNRILDALLSAGAKSWRSKEQEQLIAELSDSPTALRAWLIRLEAAKSEMQSEGILGKLRRKFTK